MGFRTLQVERDGAVLRVDLNRPERRFVAQLGWRACGAIEAVEAITLARVQGHAIGGGFALALACDFRIAARDAVFHVPEVDLGLPFTWGATRAAGAGASSPAKRIDPPGASS